MTLLSREDLPGKSYLGDGAYINVGSFIGEYEITTEDGVSVQNRVVLGPGEIRALEDYIQQVTNTVKASQEQA